MCVCTYTNTHAHIYIHMHDVIKMIQMIKMIKMIKYVVYVVKCTCTCDVCIFGQSGFNQGQTWRIHGAGAVETLGLQDATKEAGGW